MAFADVSAETISFLLSKRNSLHSEFETALRELCALRDAPPGDQSALPALCRRVKDLRSQLENADAELRSAEQRLAALEEAARMTEAEEFFAPPAQEAKHEAMAFYRGILRGVFSVEECFALAEIPAKDAAVLAELAAENPDARPMLAAVRAYREEFVRALDELLKSGMPEGGTRNEPDSDVVDDSRDLPGLRGHSGPAVVAAQVAG